MSQHDFDIANQGFPAFRSDLNNALKALASLSSGGTVPTTLTTHQFWLDTSATPFLLKLFDGTDQIILGEFNATTNKFNPYMDGSVVSTTGKAVGISVDAAAARTALGFVATTWTPTVTGITGTNTYAGSYSTFGNRAWGEIIITTSDTIAISAGATLTPPVTVAVDNTCVMANRSTQLGLGTGIVDSLIRPPAATPSAGQSIVISFTFQF